MTLTLALTIMRHSVGTDHQEPDSDWDRAVATGTALVSSIMAEEAHALRAHATPELTTRA